MYQARLVSKIAPFADILRNTERMTLPVETKFPKRCFNPQSNFLVNGGNAPERAFLEAISGKKSNRQLALSKVRTHGMS